MAWATPDQYLVGQVLTSTSMNKISSDLTWLHANGSFIVRGEVSSSGTTVAGTGFTPSRTSAGTYVITFTNAFASTPIAIVGPATNGATYLTADLTAATTTSITVQTGTGTTNTDCQFTFLAIEP